MSGSPNNLQSSSDEELARQARDGSSACFDELISRYAQRIRSYLCRRGLSGHDADDVTQETFLRAFRFLDRYDPSRPLPPWLFAIATRQLADHFRSRRADAEAADEWELAGDDPGPGDVAADREQLGRLWSIADRVLSADQRQALWLKHVEQMSIREVATVTGHSPAGVKVLLHRARRRLLDNPDVRGLLAEADVAAPLQQLSPTRSRQHGESIRGAQPDTR